MKMQQPKVESMIQNMLRNSPKVIKKKETIVYYLWTYIYSEIKFSKMHRNAEYYLQDSVGSQEDIMETELILHNF